MKKIVWPLLYVAFATVIIAGPVHAVSKILDAKPAAVVAPPAKTVPTKRAAASEEPLPDASRRPVWIAPTTEYKYPPPAVTPRVVNRDIPEAKDARNAAKSAKAEKQRRSPARPTQAALAFAEETPAPAPAPAPLPIGRD